MIFTSLNYYFLRIINYVVLIAFLIVLNDKGKVNIYLEFIIVLVYILNSQIRMYLLKGKQNLKVKIMFLISIILEITLTIVFSDLLGYQILILLYIITLDLILYFKKYFGLTLALIIDFISCYFVYYNNNDVAPQVLLFNGASILIFILLGSYLKYEEEKKIKAQDLYDRLRISEEKLILANKELESYSSTVEELTLLRERTRVSRELHDSVGHSLSALYIQLKAIKTIVSKKPELAEDMLEKNVNYVENALENVRRTVRELKPIEFEAFEEIFTIEEMVKSFSKLTGMNVKMILSKEKWRMTSDQSHNLYRIIQESMSNALRHGKAKNMTITIQFLKDKLYAHIKDDGKGCNGITPSFGLKGIKERVRSMKGTVEFYAEEEKGFAVTVTLPKFKEYIKADIL